MTEDLFDNLEQLHDADGATAIVRRLQESLQDQRDYHRLFDAILLEQKLEMGLPLTRPTSFDDVPDEVREQFEQSYVEAARRIGQLFLDDGQLPQAWVYFRMVRETDIVRDAIEQMAAPDPDDESAEELIQVALYEGANVPKGLEWLLETHGTCNTITATDQQLDQMNGDDRRRVAAMMVNHLYGELRNNVAAEVGRRFAVDRPGAAPSSLRELISGRDGLFEGGNYHIDVSHLNSVIRFARVLDADDPEMKLAVELAEYGSRLAEQLQYGSDPPFDDYYTGNLNYFSVLLDRNREQAISWFRDQLQTREQPEDRQMVAHVLVDLLVRIDRLDDAVALADEHLRDIDDSAGFSFSQLCHRAGRMDILKAATREKNDPVTFTAALLGGGPLAEGAR